MRLNCDPKGCGLNDHLTLDGTLGGMFALTRALFAVSITEVEEVSAWDPDVRLFQIAEEGTEEVIGSFYLDPFFRPIKTRRHIMAPIFEHPKTALISTTIRPPPWDHLSIDLTFEHTATLFHEFGHVLQFLLARQTGLRGGENIDVDISEVLSQFMEHWLFESSILQTLAHFSQSEGEIPAELIDQLTRERKMDKLNQLAHRVFLSELEFEYYMRSADEEESIVAMQHRIATDHIAHDPLAKSDLGPLKAIVGNNASGKRIAQYRYLLSEMISTDLFKCFRAIDLNNQNDMRELGLRFRKTLLEPGARVNRQAYEDFTGRPLSTDCLFEFYEI